MFTSIYFILFLDDYLHIVSTSLLILEAIGMYFSSFFLGRLIQTLRVKAFVM